MSDLEDKKEELTTIEKDLKEKEEAWDDAEAKFEALRELETNKNNMVSQKKDAKEELRSLEERLETKTSELEKIKTRIVEAKGKPIVLGAGHYDMGKDLPPGRYKAEPVSGSGNMFIGSDVYEREAGITLGIDHGESSFVFKAVSGDSMRLGTSVRFTPIQ
ncbi:hypothetical protein IMZ31_18925 (plasmid) [Pontibacillus sp. ALD_SL1]|uniref:hypothetical protein n=1 Tax=Pontibacillus sp. ALD_SL1 TaxID=2777185 RepID=UPI001A978658|nr:hypothetical protein [Pontibacillus sp. ALD_SL1]QST02623.1 hypothetical protein IMZ31_18925 [Pontibacillus sp. ALD_SL1]